MADAHAWTPVPVGRAKRREGPPAPPPPMLPLSGLEFVGCEAVPMTLEEFLRYEGRLEVWDAETGTAWRVRALTTAIHESPAHGLAGLVERIAAVRGSPVRCYGSTALLVRDDRGKPRRAMQADQIVYLHPSRADLPWSSAMVVGEHPYPDVVLEVDNTTDVRRGKLRLYESWGFPEVWVEVPDRRAPSRPRGLRPGLTIHLLEGSAYRESPVSRAFPGWRATSIHAAMNEAEPSGWTHAVLEHLGRTLGEQDGTGPDDDPLLRSLRDESRAEGEARGRAEGLAKAAREILRARGVACPEGPGAGIPDGVPAAAAAVAAALACDSAEDFHARLRAHAAK